MGARPRPERGSAGSLAWTAKASPSSVLGDDERWTLLRRCLRDDSLALRLRVAGALVLLYGQIPTRIVELTVDSVTTTETDTYLVLRDQPVLLPPPLAALTLELAARSTHEQSTSRLEPRHGCSRARDPAPTSMQAASRPR